ncbi:redoxin domain-containing protein [Umezawaea endophytica]|uniref:Redoxin domain-containing protein n=1 Tax=Umezawaea endophytica TaxID=1654476 RepID=A0A9X3A0Z1_9PSEU|nr:redoxin domain-containing protein [Umezawaea endophytica]MCS7477448.1 redoxin domain-containing protein [Umezawaea endophytica]
MKPVRSLGLVLAALALVAACGKPSDPAPPPAAASAPTSDGKLGFTAKTVDGKDFSGDSLAGKPAVLWFWAPWCPSCNREAPTITKLAKEITDVSWVGVAARDEVPAMEAFIAKYDMGGFPHIADLDASVWQRFGVTAQPAFAFIGEDGQADVLIGSPTEEDVRARIAKITGA